MKSELSIASIDESDGTNTQAMSLETTESLISFGSDIFWYFVVFCLDIYIVYRAVCVKLGQLFRDFLACVFY